MKKITITARDEDFKKLIEKLNDMNFRFVADTKNKKLEMYVNNNYIDSIIETITKTLDMRYTENVIETSTPDFVLSTWSKNEKEAKKLPVEQVMEQAVPYSATDPARYGLTIIAGIIALSGLIMNNPVIVIGAMLISPLLGPIYSFAINIATGKPRSAMWNIADLTILLLITMIISYMVAFIVNLISPIPMTEEILLRTQPTWIYGLVAFLLGFASILAITKGIIEIIVGAAIAAALLPPAVTAGILFAIERAKVLNATIITLQNVFGLMIGSLVGILVLKISPRSYYKKEIARKYVKASIITILFILILLTGITILF